MARSIRVQTQELHPAERPILGSSITFNSLSNEILANIACQLEPEWHYTSSRRLSLLALMRCSRLLHRITEPILYSEFLEQAGRTPSRSYSLFLKRILARPDLAARMIRYEGCAYESDDEFYIDVSCFDDDDRTRISVSAFKITDNAEEAAELVGLAYTGSWEAITTLTLSLTMNVQDIHFNGWAESNDYYPNLVRFLSRAAMLQKSGDLAHPFSLNKLKRVRQDWGCDEFGFNLDTLLPLLSIPSVDTFRSTRINDERLATEIDDEDEEYETPEWLHSDYYFPHIKNLSLKWITTDVNTMPQFLKRFSKLETLYYDHGCSGYVCFEPPRMMAALNELKSSLRSLSVFDNTDESESEGGPLQEFPMGPFEGFDKLRRLEMSPRLLFGSLDEDRVLEGFHSKRNIVEALPSAIEELIFVGCDYDEAFLPELISSKSTHFPALQSIDTGWQKIEFPNKPPPN